MAVITTPLAFNQYMLSYLKERWTSVASQGVAIQPGFTAWLQGRNNSLSTAMATRLASLTVLDATNNLGAFKTFADADLPSDNESKKDYVIRYVYNRLENSQLVNDVACQQTMNGITFITSATAGAAWNTWWNALAPTARPATFPAAVTAFKNHVGTSGHLVTGEAVQALAALCNFDYTGWVTQQLTSIGNGGPTDLALPKIKEGAACWNWALSACGNTAVDPDEVMTWLHSPLPANGADPSMPASIVSVVAPGPQLNAKNDLIAVKAQMHQDQMATMAANYDPTWNTDGVRFAKIAGLNQRVFSAILTLNGFTVATGPTQFAVGIEYQPRQGVSWEHWWVEYGHTIVETFPTMMFNYNATDRRQVARMAPAQAADYAVALINVQSLLTRHNEVVGAGMAQYL